MKDRLPKFGQMTKSDFRAAGLPIPVKGKPMQWDYNNDKQRANLRAETAHYSFVRLAPSRPPPNINTRLTKSKPQAEGGDSVKNFAEKYRREDARNLSEQVNNVTKSSGH